MQYFVCLQPIYELQTVKPESMCHISSSETPLSHLYSTVQKPSSETQPVVMMDKKESVRGAATLSSNLSELDNLLAELSSSQFTASPADQQPANCMTFSHLLFLISLHC